MRKSNEYICMRDGSKFYLEKPTLKSIRLNDIAHALSMICRYTGHVPEFYSVAQHAVLVSLLSKYPLAALHHDSSEAFVGDVNKPLKRMLGNDYCEIESGIMFQISKRFNFKWGGEVHDEIKYWDVVVLGAEVLSMMPEKAKNFNLNKKLNREQLKQAKKIKIEAFTWEDSKSAFLARHKELCHGRNS